MDEFLKHFGQTLIFIFAIFILLIGLKMVLKVADPYVRKASPSLADALKTNV